MGIHFAVPACAGRLGRPRRTRSPEAVQARGRRDAVQAPLAQYAHSCRNGRSTARRSALARNERLLVDRQSNFEWMCCLTNPVDLSARACVGTLW